jgi:hypothetical protein
MLEWAFKKENKVRIKFIERELERIKKSIYEIEKYES